MIYQLKSSTSSSGVTVISPDELEFPATMTDLEHSTWLLSGNNVLRNQMFVKSNYPIDLDDIKPGMRLGLKWRANGDLSFYQNGKDEGVAVTDVPSGLLVPES